jgi:hypothetical protein
MITDLLLNFLFSVVDTILSALFSAISDTSLPASIASSISTAGGYLSAFDFVVPTDTILTILALVLSVEGSILFYKAIMWLIKKIPTIS